MTTTDKIRAHFRRFPNADVNKVAQKFNTAYVDSPAVTESSTVVVTLTLPSDGAYAAQNAYSIAAGADFDDI